MIVISGALVLVSLVLLVLGLVLRDLDLVYGSIAVSLVSFVFLVIGVLQRRGDRPYDDDPEAPDTDDPPARGGRTPSFVLGPAGQPVAGTPAPPVREQVRDDRLDDVAGEADAGLAAAGGGGGSVPLVLPDTAAPPWPAPDGLADPVVVLPERSRYHDPHCRFVRDVVGVEQLTRAQAEERAYTPCEFCRP